MIGFTLAIGDFMGLLITSALWVAGGILAWLLLGGGVALGVRMWRHAHRGR